MANGRNRGQKVDPGRDAGGFIALPWSVVDSPAYTALSMHARCLLVEVSRQIVKDNNGRLLLSRAYMEKRGWKSVDMLTKAKRELLAAGFIYETAKGQRPNKASWYAVTWRALDRMPGYDAGAAELFERGAYQKNAPLTPPRGAVKSTIAPRDGVGKSPPTPPHGAIGVVLCAASTPSDGDHLDMPSVAKKSTTPMSQQSMQPPAHETIEQLWAALRNCGAPVFKPVQGAQSKAIANAPVKAAHTQVENNRCLTVAKPFQQRCATGGFA